MLVQVIHHIDIDQHDGRLLHHHHDEHVQDKQLVRHDGQLQVNDNVGE